MLNSLFKSFFLFITLFSISLQLSAQRQLEFLYEEDLTFRQKVERAEAFFDDQGRGKGTGYKQFLRWKYIAQQSLDDDGYVLSEESNIEEFERYLSRNPRAENRSMMNTWVEKGPLSATNTSTWSSHIGRLSNIAIDPNDDTHLVVTSLGGGVWKTTDEGANWTPLFDQESTMNLQSAMISHANDDHYFIGGSGIWKTTDGGTSFSKLNGPSGNIYSIVMDPMNADIILASSSNGRVYKTTNGGDTWTSVLLQSNIQFYDLDFRPSSSSTLYACGSQGAFYQSTDQGNSWNSVSGPWNSNRTIMFAVTDDDADYIYVLQEESGGFGGLYLSTDGGVTWSTQSDDSGNNNNIMGYDLNQKGGQAPRDMDVIVSPTDKTEVHVAGVMTFRSYDSGATWSQTTSWLLSSSLAFVHADIDQMIYSGSKIYVASDGGIFISSDQASTFEDKTTGLGIRQFYRISASPTEVGRVAGGSQDNGTGILKEGVWYDFLGADGMEPLIVNNDDNIVIGSIQFGQLSKSIDGGISTVGISQTQGGANGEWVTPLERDPVAANTIYQGKSQLYKSIDAGGGWTTISDFGNFGNMDEIAIAPTDNNIIYVSFGTLLFKTTDGGSNWNQLSTNPVGNYINYINIDPKDENHIILAVSNNNRFIESTDGGLNWSSIRYDLPNIASRSIAFDGTDDNGIYVSLAKGVYFKDDNSPTSWTLLDDGLPKVDARGKGYTLNANYQLLDCISNGTPDSLDDSFTFHIDPSGMGLGTTYSITGDITENNIPYGAPYVFDNNGDGYLKENGALELTLTDDANADIVSSFKIYPNLAENCYNNLQCENAFPITTTGTYYATGPISGGGGSQANRNANWFYFIPKADGIISINSCGKGVDTRLYVHRGTCDDKVVLGSNDDSCSMGPGLNNWASQVNDIIVESGQQYFIEWDNRWSSSGFFFEFEYIEECIDYLIYNVDGIQDSTVVTAVTQIRLDGNLGDALETRTQGIVVMPDDITVNVNGSLDLSQESCDRNTLFDVKMLKGNSTAIPDNGVVDIPFIFPNIITENVTDFKIGLNLNHDDISQLKISLVNPNNDAILVWDGYCSTDSNLYFILDRGALVRPLCSNIWRSGYPVIADGMLTAAEINLIVGSSIAGEWKLRFEDTASGVTGVLKEVFIHFEGE